MSAGVVSGTVALLLEEKRRAEAGGREGRRPTDQHVHAGGGPADRRSRKPECLGGGRLGPSSIRQPATNIASESIAASSVFVRSIQPGQPCLEFEPLHRLEYVDRLGHIHRVGHVDRVGHIHRVGHVNRLGYVDRVGHIDRLTYDHLLTLCVDRCQRRALVTAIAVASASWRTVSSRQFDSVSVHLASIDCRLRARILHGRVALGETTDARRTFCRGLQSAQ